MNRKTISAILTVISIYMPYVTLALILFALYDYWLDWFYLLLMGTLAIGLISLAIEIFIEPKKKEQERSKKMSKGLEYVRDELNLTEDHLTTYDRVMLKQVEKELEAFDIIKSKNVNCFKLKFCKDLEDYNLNLVGLVNFKTNELEGEIGLTQEEFYLLKEVL